ncbi:MAG: hypothetical protein EOP51_26355, partial [Sphingobacteriales bacterium]
HWPGGSLFMGVSGVGVLEGSVGNNPGAGGVVEGIISGIKYNDLNKSGTRENGEGVLSGVTIYLDNDNDNTFSTGDVSTTTDGDGNYSFGDLLPGTHTVREVVPTNYTQTEPGASHTPAFEYAITIAADNFNHPNNNFGNFTCVAPTVTFTGTLAAQCSNSTTYLLTGGAPSGGSYSGDGVTGSNFNASATSTGEHTITYTYTDANGCSNTATNITTVNATPDPPSLGPQTFCSNASHTVGDLPTGYSYYDASNGTTPLSASTELSTGTYYATVTTTDCESAKGSFAVTVNPSTGATSFTLPVTTVCQDAANTTYAATAANSTSIVYSVLPAGAGTINSATGVMNWDAAFSGQATIKAVASGLCGTTETEVVVTVNPTFCVAYTGDLFKNTGDPAGGTATVNLIVVVTKSPLSSSAALNPGTFTMLVDGSPLSNASVTTTPSADGTQITYSAPYTVALPYQGTSLSRDLTVTWTFGNSCTISSCSETSTIVTVSAPADDFVTGGGYIIPTDSYFKGRPGSIGDMHVNGAKNNFGFNVKWNKSLKNLQGNWNTIIRRMESDGIHLYQVKAKPSTLVVTKISDKSYRADMVFTSVNFKDLTTGLWSDGGGSSSVNVSVIDNGEPASGVDQIFISIKDKNGSSWYTSSTSTLPANIRANDATIK